MYYATQIPFFSLIFSDQSSSNLIVTGVSIGAGVLIAVVVGLVILWVLIRRNSRKENNKGDYGMRSAKRRGNIENTHLPLVFPPFPSCQFSNARRVLSQCSTLQMFTILLSAEHETDRVEAILHTKKNK